MITEKLDLFRYLNSIRKRWPLVLTIFTSVMLVGVIYTLRSQKLYKASAKMVIMPHAPRILTGIQEVNPTGTTSSFWAEEAFLQTEYRIMVGRPILTRVFERMGLDQDPAYKGQDPVDALSPYISINPVRKTRIVSVDVVHPDPQIATDLANTLTSIYLDFKVEKHREVSGEASNWLQIQHGDLKKKLEGSEDQLYDYMKLHGILNASLESQQETLKGRIGMFVGKLAEVQAKQIADRSSRDLLEQAIHKPELLHSIATIQDAPRIATFKSKLVNLRKEQKTLSERYLPSHPRMQKLQTETRAVEAGLSLEIENRIQMFNREQQALIVTERGLKKAIKAERRQEAHLNKLGLDYGRLKREVDTNANLYDLVANRLKEIGLTGMLQVNNVSMLDAARVPGAPYKPDWKTNMLASLFFAVFLSLGLALLLEILDQTFKDQEEVESFLGLPFLGIMPAISPESKLPKNPTKKELMALARKKDLYSETHSKSTLSECARAIRTNLLFMTPDKPFRSLLVSSSLAGEGKTTLAVNLAVTMAQAGSRVILVDADLRRPRIHKSFQVENEIGLSNLIVNSSDMNEAIVHSSIDNLDLLPCGPVPPNPAELLHTSGFKQTLEELYKRYDKIIFDSPPVSAVTDPVVLGTSVDGVLMVIKTGTTHRNAVKRSVRALQDAHARILGVVLNDSEASKTQYGYSYARYYWYGNYYYGGQYGEKSAEG